MPNLEILEHDTRELFDCSEDYEVIKECSQILDRLDEIEAGEEPLIGSEIAEYRNRITELLNRE